MRTILLLLAVAAVSVGLTSPAAAAKRVPVEINMDLRLTGPDSVEGTFTSTIGSIEDSGTVTQTYLLDGDVIDDVKVLRGRHGTLVLSVRAVVEYLTPTLLTFDGGSWRFLLGTGDYAGIRGGGRPGTTGSADLTTGIAEVSHRGSAQLRRP